MTTYIYHLLDHEGRVRYVGKSNDPKRRMAQHLTGRGKTHCAAWIRSLRSAGHRPKMVIVRECGEADWEQAEKDEIAKQKAAGANLCNLTEGGETGCGPYTPEMREALSRSHRRNWRDREYRRRQLGLMRAGLARAKRRQQPDDLPKRKTRTERMERIKAKRKELQAKYFAKLPHPDYELEDCYAPYLTNAFIEKYYDQLT